MVKARNNAVFLNKMTDLINIGLFVFVKEECLKMYEVTLRKT